ncbi:MAG: electron transfer flavoprotein beta subunit/FixA family protein [Acidobacteria bacterium]|nr:MAG: electron transfer flavoprotein beta subunit/FixA family protein [Acidobacteriota bacterium]REK01094.1 MAG: electron transfer flavoprotein beta subunit/FixA family protein [Acidobacteriota bacterium]
MNILVCIKQILDPDLPARDFKIDAANKEADPKGANKVTNIFCENALETALQLREKAGGGKVTAITYGPEGAEDSLRKALAMTVDEAVLVINDKHSKPDAIAVGKVLAAAARKLGDFDLVMVGRESGDWGLGQTGGVLAEELGLPSLAFVDEVDPDGDGLKLQRQTDNGSEVATVKPPALVLITNNENNVPRIPKTRDVMMSYRKPLQKLTLEELGVADEAVGDGHTAFEVTNLYVPEKSVSCEFVQGDSLDEKVTELARRIHGIVASVN